MFNLLPTIRKKKLWMTPLLILSLTACSGQTGAPTGSVPNAQSPVQTPTTDSEIVDDTNDNEMTENENSDSAGSIEETTFTSSLTGEVETVTDQLNTPWDIQFADDTIYMTLRGGSIVKFENGEQTQQTLTLSPEVLEEGEGGLLGFALAPDFADSRTAYVYHTYGEGNQIHNRVIQIKEAADGANWNETAVLLDDIPGARVHDGGRIAFGPDNMLYVTTGDAQDESSAQDPASVAGKILRMTPEGDIPSDNPIAGSLVYSYGHRNSQGIDWLEDGTMYASEHGPSGNPGGHDEMNKITPGANYGWPDVIGDAEGEGLTAPLYHTGETAIAPSGIAATPDGKLLVANLRGESLTLFDPQNNKMTELLTGVGRIRDVAIHDGQIYILTNNTDGRGSPSEKDDQLLIVR
ncbi:sorbosone dehydrogenase family protein [Saccharibacillus sp. JS10]|uniref:PQQ-dependent sugar dehydrogenase n=1 Tax=Saccharibacillus sp. JS10 TaxID=2950552 RepID=UPI00210F00D5|nr:PQQ-dependent sugar dehydrogenase [Saccharibacillus sp. JS10]MCQ4088614.1 PQQ-dependent sugar dehydrogenase [Saccharibacillus sp. JS10]